jgi:ABC-type branched-subunit amino acid transport system substrate-binding protein
MSLKRLLAILIALSFAAAACSGSDDDEDSSGTTETESDDSGSSDADSDSDSGDSGGETVLGRGVTDDTIKIGFTADLSGIFAPLVTQIVDAQEVYWDQVNANGGIDGRMIELVIEDNAYDVPTQLENWEDLKDEVAIIAHSTGSPHTSAIAEDAAEENMIILPLSWYSGWSDADFGELIFENYSNYCVESMNAVSWMNEEVEDLKLAIISFPGEYGQDGAAGAKLAAEALGIEVVYDGEAAVVPGADQTPVISEIVSSGATGVYATINPTTLGEIMGGTVAQGSTAIWSGNSPTFNYLALSTDLGPALDEYYFHSTYTSQYGSDAPGTQAMVDAMAAALPDNPISDTYIIGWTQGMIVDQILRQASANGDLSPEGIRNAAFEVEVDFQGLAPNQGWAGDPNDFIVRDTYIYDVSLDDFNPLALGEGLGSTGIVPVEGFAPFTSQVAADFDYTGPCFEPQG